MAPHGTLTPLYQDDLQNLFDLAEALFQVNPSCHMTARGSDVVSGGFRTFIIA